MRGVPGRLVREQRGQHQLLAVHGCGMDGGARCAERMHCAADAIAHASANASADAIAHAAAHAAADGIANAVADAVADPCANARADSGADTAHERVQPSQWLRGGFLLQPRHEAQPLCAVHRGALQRHTQRLHEGRPQQRDGMCGMPDGLVRAQRGQRELRAMRRVGMDGGACGAECMHDAAHAGADAESHARTNAASDAIADARAVAGADAGADAIADTESDARTDAASDASADAQPHAAHERV